MQSILKKINKSASYAISGMKDTFKEEFMCRVQFTFGLIQFVLGLILGFTFIQMIIIFAIWMLLVSLEFMNTGIENLSDLVSKDKEHYIKRAKDSAAASVFLISVTSWIIFVLFIIVKIK